MICIYEYTFDWHLNIVRYLLCHTFLQPNTDQLIECCWSVIHWYIRNDLNYSLDITRVLREFVESMDFHGTHGISWIHELYIVSTKFSWNPRSFHGLHEVSMEPTKFSWNPRSFHGLHEISMEPTKFSWNPRTFHGLHEVFMESTMFSWIPRNFHGIHEGRGIHENSPRNFHEVRGIHEKANWIVPLTILKKKCPQLCLVICLCVNNVWF